MASKRTWAIDIGSNALKALHLQWNGESIEVIGFDYIEHSQFLSAPGMTEEKKQDIVRETLHTFAERQEVHKDPVAISVPGRNSFARFVQLPPVEKKGIPKVVQYEAVQQIPFDINEVEWDWQLMEDEDSPDTTVGLFAIKNEVVSDELENYANEKMNVSCVQIGPMALFNYLNFDQELEEKKATILLDMGAENTNMVVCTKNNVWQRSIRIGGNAFTETIAEAFKLDFAKAEKLKRTAAVSKYAKQLFTAMKPTFSDLSSEIQRSLGFYSTSGPGRDSGFVRIIAMGGGMKLQGLAKYLGKSLNLPVIKPDSFDKLILADGVSSATFHENVSDFGIAYGLGVQVFDQGKIETNLLPSKMARAMMWQRKGMYLNLAAGFLLLVSLASLGKVILDKGQYSDADNYRRTISSAISEASEAESKLLEQQARQQQLENAIEQVRTLFEYRDTIPRLNETMVLCLPNAENTPDQKDLFQAYNSGEVGTILSYPRSDRKQLFVTSVSLRYVDSVSSAVFTEASRRRTTTTRTSPTGMEGYGDMPGGMPGGDPYMPGGMPPREPTRRPSSPQPSQEGEEGAQDGPGFIVQIEGYSPYKEINNLLDPAGVENIIEKWGFVTRLQRIEQVIPDAPFRLFNKNQIAHFQLTTGEVDLADPEMPEGIGVLTEVERIPVEETEDPRNPAARRTPTRSTARGGTPDKVFVEEVLIDPMTNEEMSKTYSIITQEDVDRAPSLTERDLGRVRYTQFNEPEFIIRDHWFRINAKLIWTQAPETAQASGSSSGYNTY